MENEALLDETPRVLYLHGFEETRQSPKPKALLADPNLSVQMPNLGVYFSHRNSPLVSLAVVTLPFSVPAAILTSMLPVVLLTNPYFWALASTVLTASLYMLRHHLISRSIGRSFDRSYEVARRALVAFKPHAVVGFSVRHLGGDDQSRQEERPPCQVRQRVSHLLRPRRVVDAEVFRVWFGGREGVVWG